MKRALLLAAAIVAAGPACAEWTYFADDEFDNKFYVDYSTLRSTANGRRVWVLTNNAKIEDGISSSKTLIEIDCAEERRRILQNTAHKGPMGTGESSASEGPGAWRYVSPGTIMAGMLKAICRRK